MTENPYRLKLKIPKTIHRLDDACMAYKKVLVDNVTCNRRFHITYDDEGPKEALVEIKCLHCDAVVFHKENHPQPTLARDENLIKTTELSQNRTKECFFEDSFSVASKPKT